MALKVQFGIGADTMRQAHFTLTNAEVLALPTTPKTLAPGIPNCIQIPLWAVMEYTNVANVTGINIAPFNYFGISDFPDQFIALGYLDESNAPTPMQRRQQTELLANGPGISRAYLTPYQFVNGIVTAGVFTYGETEGVTISGTPHALPVGTPLVIASGNGTDYTGGNTGNKLDIWMAWNVVQIR